MRVINLWGKGRPILRENEKTNWEVETNEHDIEWKREEKKKYMYPLIFESNINNKITKIFKKNER